MAKYTGTVLRSDLEGGGWSLKTDQGVIYQLKGGGADLLVDGARVEVQGQVDPGQVGITMMGEVLVVKSYRLV